ncbi:MAG: hypothetical protein ACRDHJ_02375 [Actinomycetota bacterium]
MKVLSLGYAVCDWITANFRSPTDETKPFVLTREQARTIILWYSLDPLGRFVYRRALVMGPKGHGKSPLAALVALAEFGGAPVLPDGSDARGRPVGRPWGTGDAPSAWVQIAAVSEDQANSNVYQVAWELLSAADGAPADSLRIDLGRSRLFLRDSPGAKLEAVTSNWGAREGQRLSFAVADEVHHWRPANGGQRLARTLRRNASKVGGRILECANAFELGSESVAEGTTADYESGAPGILLVANKPSETPTPDMDNATLLKLLREVYGDSYWVPLERILEEIRDPGTPFEESLRFFFNVPASDMAAAIDPERWNELAQS